MPKKIKKHKEAVLSNKEKLLNVNNVHYVLLALFIILLIVCSCVGLAIYSADKYHAHKNQAIKSFTYTEKVNNGGYNIYTIDEMEDKNIYTGVDTPEYSTQKKWGRNKYLDFNEELYSSGILDNETQIKVENSNPDWSLEIEFIDGASVYYSSSSGKDIDKTVFTNMMKNYFNADLLYK